MKMTTPLFVLFFTHVFVFAIHFTTIIPFSSSSIPTVISFDLNIII